MCVEALQTLQKETDALEEAERSLLDTQDCLDKQRDDLKLDKIKAEVSRDRQTNKSSRISYVFLVRM
jgi:FtsZ-binding cell division protein ZapB